MPKKKSSFKRSYFSPIGWCGLLGHSTLVFTGYVLGLNKIEPGCDPLVEAIEKLAKLKALANDYGITPEHQAEFAALLDAFEKDSRGPLSLPSLAALTTLQGGLLELNREICLHYGMRRSPIRPYPPEKQDPNACTPPTL